MSFLPKKATGSFCGIIVRAEVGKVLKVDIGYGGVIPILAAWGESLCW